MERNIDLSILKKLPELKTQAVLSIRPLAPLSMVSELPGSFYKTMKYPIGSSSMVLLRMSNAVTRAKANKAKSVCDSFD